MLRTTPVRYLYKSVRHVTRPAWLETPERNTAQKFVLHEVLLQTWQCQLDGMSHLFCRETFVATIFTCSILDETASGAVRIEAVDGAQLSSKCVQVVLCLIVSLSSVIVKGFARTVSVFTCFSSASAFSMTSCVASLYVSASAAF